MSRKRCALLMIYALCFAIVFLAGRGWQNHRIREWDAAATQVCALLCGHDFDGVEMDVAGKKIALYERVAQDPFASVLTRRSVATVACTAGEMEIVQNFRDIRSFQGGNFLCGADRLGWRVDGRIHFEREFAGGSRGICHAAQAARALLASRGARCGFA